MSQIGGKMSKFYGETDIVSTYLRIILSNFVATDVYALFKKSIKKFCNMMFKTKGGAGGQRLFEQCSKKLRIWRRRAPLSRLHLLDFSPMCVFKCLLKSPAQEDAKSHWLHLSDFSLLFKCVLNVLGSE